MAYSCLFSCQVFDNYAVTVMIGGEPYTLGLFDTAGEKPSFFVIVLDQDLSEVMLNIENIQLFVFVVVEIFLIEMENVS